MKYRAFSAKQFFDPWSMPHFLFGMLAALVAIVFSLPALYSFFVTFVFAFLWELLEKYCHVGETSGNALTDIVLALFAFCFTFLFINRADPNPAHHSALLIVVFLSYISINFFAWRARFDHDREFRT